MDTPSDTSLELELDTPHVPLSTQVGGHPGILTTEDGSLLIKPALPTELAFYQLLAAERKLQPLREYVPAFLGTLKLEGALDPNAGGGEGGGGGMSVVESVVLENLTYAFTRPNVCDIKLGTVLFDESAAPEKRARMERVARETTAGEWGMHFTAFQVHDVTTNEVVISPRAECKALRAPELPDAFARFFPLYAPLSLPNPPSKQGTGLQPDVLLAVLQGLRAQVAGLRSVLGALELRAVGASLLVLYEADHAAAREAFERLRALEAAQSVNLRKRKLGPEVSEREDEEDEEDEGEEDGEEEDEDEDEEVENPLFVVKLIDFAHTRLVPGRGPDEGVIKGLETVLSLFDNRIEEVRAAKSKATAG